MQLVFQTENGKKYTFTYSDFRKDADSERVYWLEAMRNIQKHYDPGIIRYDGLEDLDKVISQWGLNQAETAMLYQLFGRKES